jgi:soluble lytic murein transglycosylase-like protein
MAWALTVDIVDPSLALAVATQKSGLDPKAVSPAGAIGVMQLMPATAADLKTV